MSSANATIAATGAQLPSSQSVGVLVRRMRVVRGERSGAARTRTGRRRGTRLKRRSDRPIEHILLAAYLYSPCNVVSAHRPLGLRRGFEAAGVRTTVMTSKISGSAEDDEAQGVIRAGDLRTRFRTQYQELVGYSGETGVASRDRPRWWTNFVVPDITALTWFPQALRQLLKLIRKDRPDAIVTTSGPESTHLLGLVARAFGVRWVADYRDGWLRDVSHPFFLRPVDRLLERLIARRATFVSAINEEIASDVRRRYGVSAHVISNGFDMRAIESATDERAKLDAKRFSLVYTGMFGMDLEEPVLHRGRDARMFLDALELLLEREPQLTTSFELVAAGTISDTERELLGKGNLGRVTRVMGRVPHSTALGLQQAADGLLLIPGGIDATTAKVFEYLAAKKPIFAITERQSAAAELLSEAGAHTAAPPTGPEELAAAFRAYLARWAKAGEQFQPSPAFDLGAYEYESLGRKMLDLIDAEGAAPKRKPRFPKEARTNS